MKFGVNSFVWVSPCTTEAVKELSLKVKSMGFAILEIACENDRGVPGTGQVYWQEIAKALQSTNYQGPVVIESFTSQVKEIARAVNIWREIAPSQDAIATQGLQFLKTLFA